MNREFLLNILGRWKHDIERINPNQNLTLYERARSKNGWFTEESINLSINGLIRFLDPARLEKWIPSEVEQSNPKEVGIVTAGNIPMVGFHDLLCILVSGHSAMIKLSHQDEVLMQHILEILFKTEPSFRERIKLVDKLDKPDAVIATGSDNTARYFHYYFREIPNIIRKNRTSIAVINGSENKASLQLLGHDILTYFGLGCRNVSKLLVPENYSFSTFFESVETSAPLLNVQKYHNNYDYNKSIYLVNGENFLDNGFMLLKQSNDLVSPVAVTFYQEYNSLEEAEQYIEENKRKIQCVVTNQGWLEKSIPFGSSQEPELWDYADDINTLEFLLDL